MSITDKQVYLKYAQPVLTSSVKNDINSPLSFKEWYSAYQNIIPNQEYRQYNEYLIEWHKTKSKSTPDSKLQLKLNYLTLLKQLQLFFTQEETENWYNKVNVENEKELLLAIPYFAKKLKDISYYYLQLRKKIKESRLKYNQVGTNTGIIQEVQKIILNKYTKKDNEEVTLPAQIWNNVPLLSSVSKNLVVEVEELYDFHNYFDISPSVPLSSYFDIDSKELLNFLETKNLSLTSTDWIYKLGVFPLSGSTYEDEEIGRKIAEKYLAEDKYFSTKITNNKTNVELFDINIGIGNNNFFWPGSVYETKALTFPRYAPVALSSLNLETIATAGSSIDLADTIFIKDVNGTKGAWLKHNIVDYRKDNMNAVLLPSSKTVFKFPFPGYGLSGEDLPWTDFSLNYDRRYKFLDEETKQSIESLYWSQTIDLTSSKPLPINDSTLIDCKAYAHKNYNHADKIRVSERSPVYDDTSVYDVLNESWLYKFDKTDISISRENNNVIFWPYEKIDTEKDFPDYYPTNISNICTSEQISSIDLPFAVASQDLSSSDVIYKINNYLHDVEDAVECCWLSGKEIKFPDQKLILTDQNSLQLFLSAGSYTKFTWLGQDLSDANTVFKNVKHQPDCKFKNTKYVTYLDYTKCDCHAVKFSPFGHPGENYTENKGLADFIVEDTVSPAELDLGAWKDQYSTNFISSSSFGWFKTNDDIGWGQGTWVNGNTNTGNKLYLKYGKKYIYYRTNVKHLDTETYNLPEYVLRHPYKKPNNNVWIRGKKTPDGLWVNDGVESNMTINPGDLLIYSRKQTISQTLTGTIQERNNVYENRGSVWSNADYLSVDENRYVVFSYPSITYYTDTNTSQLPKVNISNILGIRGWTITAPDQTKQHFLSQSSVSFVPLLTGLYTASVTAISGDPTRVTKYGSYSLSGIYVFNNIPAVTAVSPFTDVISLTSHHTPIPGYVINVPLKGWDYNTSTYNLITKKENQGARPYWAKVNLSKDSKTNYKGIESTGNSLRLVDDHNIISQPEFTDINLNSGSKIEYTRKYPVKIDWVQPIDLEVVVDEKYWVDLNFDTTQDSNLADFLYNDKKELVVSSSDTKSQLTITNIIDNSPVEINYNALNSFSWQISVTPEISETFYDDVSATLAIKAEFPWANLNNTNYPTVAVIPSIEDLQSVNDVGGYFTPNNLGVTIYTDQNFETKLTLSSDNIESVFEDNTKKYKTRGLTKEQSNTPYELKSQNNTWFKESVIGNASAGTIKKDIFKKYQKFLPYQSAYESNPRISVGLIEPTAKQHPWGGKEDQEWLDKENHPLSPTEQLHLINWTDDQILKQFEYQIDDWVTDIFGNQYGLFKYTKNIYTYDRKYYYGEIWVRKNSQKLLPASKALTNVFDTYGNLDIKNELLNYGIFRIDMFFDTLMIETSGAIIFEKINYDYENDNIFSLTNDARHISLAMPVTASFDREINKVNLENYNFAFAGDTWFFPEQKEVAVSVCGWENGNVYPELYSLNLNNQVLEKIFPLIDEDISTIKSLTSENIVYVNPPVLSYNSSKEEYVMSILCDTNEERDLILEFTIGNDYRPKINNLVIYKSHPIEKNLNPPFIEHPLYVSTLTGNEINFPCVAENGPVTFNVISKPDWLQLSPNGVFTGIPLKRGRYETYFTVSNENGPVYYNFSVDVRPPIVEEEPFYIYTEGYSTLSADDGFILQQEETDSEEYKILITNPTPVVYFYTNGYFNIPGEEDSLILCIESTSEEEEIILIL